MRVKRMMGAAAILCAAGLLCVPAFAQRQGGGFGPQLSPEVAAKIWEMQAKTVAKDLSLNDDLTKKLVDAYKASRESLVKSVQEAMQGGGAPGGGPGGPGEAFRKLMADERAKLSTAVGAFLNPEQTKSAVAVLGSFNMRWDGMVNAIDGLGLDEKVKGDALKAVESFVVESAKAREAAGSDQEAMRAKSAELREKLEADLGKILSAEQLAKLKESPGFRRGGPGGGGPGGPGGRLRGDRDGGAPAAGGAAPAAPSTPPAPGEKKKEE